MCGSCTTAVDFESAAKVWYGEKQIKFQVSIGNPNTGKIYTIWLSPGSTGLPASVANNGYIYSAPQKFVITTNDLLARRYANTSSGAVVIDSANEDAANEPKFKTAVLATKNKVLFNATPDMIATGGFNSFAAYQPEDVCPEAWAMMSASNPQWAKRIQ